MKFRKLMGLMFIYSLVQSHCFLSLASDTDEIAQRAGIFADFGLGIQNLHISTSEVDKLSFFIDPKIGYGINEKLLVYFENYVNTVYLTDNYDGEGLILYSPSVGVQYFPLNDHRNELLRGLYGNGHIGFGLAVEFIEDRFGEDFHDFWKGVSLGLGVGYEQRLGKHFKVAPEVRFDYLYLAKDGPENPSVTLFGAAVKFGYYF